LPCSSGSGDPQSFAASLVVQPEWRHRPAPHDLAGPQRLLRSVDLSGSQPIHDREDSLPELDGGGRISLCQKLTIATKSASASGEK
jgi:hypothetical protein